MRPPQKISKQLNSNVDIFRDAVFQWPKSYSFPVVKSGSVLSVPGCGTKRLGFHINSCGAAE